jgi:hypothetical protein
MTETMWWQCGIHDRSKHRNDMVIKSLLFSFFFLLFYLDFWRRMPADILRLS